MSRVIVDLVFMLVVLTWLIYGFLFLQEITLGEFFIGLMINYIGARFLLWSDLQFMLMSVEVEETDE